MRCRKCGTLTALVEIEDGSVMQVNEKGIHAVRMNSKGNHFEQVAVLVPHEPYCTGDDGDKQN